MINSINKNIFNKMKSMIGMKKTLEIVVELLNNKFVIYGDFCRNILNNNINDVIDVYCTMQQYIYFGNISLYEMDDETLCINFVNYLKNIFKDFERVYVNMTIMRNKYHRYISCKYDNITINFQINEDIIDNNFMCNLLRIYKKSDNKITTDEFSKFVMTNGCSGDIEFSIGNMKNISIVEVIKNTKMKYAMCLHRYRRNENKIYFIQTFYCCRKKVCDDNPFICNKKYKKMIKKNIHNDNINRGLCPCEIKIFMREFLKLHNEGYKIKLTNNLIIDYNDVIWPSYFDNLSYKNLKLNTESALDDKKEIVVENLSYMFSSNFSVKNENRRNSYDNKQKRTHDDKLTFSEKNEDVSDYFSKNEFVGMQNENVSTSISNIPLSPLLNIPLSPLIFPSVDEFEK